MSTRLIGVLTLATAAVLACDSEPLGVESQTASSALAPQASRTSATVAQARPKAHSGRQLPFHGSFTNETYAVFTPPTTLTINGTATGRATHLGRFTASSVDVVDITTTTSTGTFVLTAANGDLLFAVTVGGEDERDPSDPPNVSRTTLVATIAGGTGRFAAATGTFTIRAIAVIDFAAATSSGSGSFEGHIDLNK